MGNWFRAGVDVGWGAGGEPSRHAQDDLGLSFEDGWGRGGRVAVTERPAHPPGERGPRLAANANLGFSHVSYTDWSEEGYRTEHNIRYVYKYTCYDTMS